MVYPFDFGKDCGPDPHVERGSAGVPVYGDNCLHRKMAELLASRVRQSSQDVVRLTTALSIAMSS
jgi:hypothetical protein